MNHWPWPAQCMRVAHLNAMYCKVLCLHTEATCSIAGSIYGNKITMDTAVLNSLRIACSHVTGLCPDSSGMTSQTSNDATQLLVHDYQPQSTQTLLQLCAQLSLASQRRHPSLSLLVPVSVPGPLGLIHGDCHSGRVVSTLCMALSQGPFFHIFLPFLLLILVLLLLLVFHVFEIFFLGQAGQCALQSLITGVYPR